jgi:hypothetical protein
MRLVWISGYLGALALRRLAEVLLADCGRERARELLAVVDNCFPIERACGLVPRTLSRSPGGPP